jgi:AraC family transcriptional activator of mtrCDE
MTAVLGYSCNYRTKESIWRKTLVRLSKFDLNTLMENLAVEFVRLTECLVSPGWRLVLSPSAVPAIHYCLAGKGKMLVEGHAPIDFEPHTMIIVPPNQDVSIEVAHADASAAPQIVRGNWHTFTPGEMRKFVIGEGEPRALLICGYFRTSYASMDPFTAFGTPIVELFEPEDQQDQRLKAALGELEAQEVGTGAMTSALMKQVLVALLRRSLRSPELWSERFAMFSDPLLTKAIAGMIARPGDPHTVQSLSQAAGRSRSVFMARFRHLFGRSPIDMLREVRMRRAARLLETENLSIEQIARAVGYANRNSFLRAFRKVYDCDPSAYRQRAADAASA